MTSSLLPLDCITFHPLVGTLPRWADDSAELDRLADDIGARGLDQPIIVVPGGEGYLLVDGRHRYLAAKKAGLVDIPVIVRDEAEAGDIVLHTLCDRRHLTKGALAYLSYPVISAMAQGPGRKPSIESTVKPAEVLAATLGFGRDLFFQAKQLHDKFTARPDLRVEFEPRIVAGEVGLGACLAGIAGMDATVGKGRNDRPIEQLILAGFKDLKGRFAKWDSLTATARFQVTDAFKETVFDLPADVQTELHKALQAKLQAA